VSEPESVDQSTVDDRTSAAGAGIDGRGLDHRSARMPADVDAPAPMTRLALIGLITLALLAVAWFGVSWAVFNSPVVDAVGEAVGGALLLGVLASAFGAVRGNR